MTSPPSFLLAFLPHLAASSEVSSQHSRLVHEQILFCFGTQIHRATSLHFCTLPGSGKLGLFRLLYTLACESAVQNTQHSLTCVIFQCLHIILAEKNITAELRIQQNPRPRSTQSGAKCVLRPSSSDFESSGSSSSRSLSTPLSLPSSSVTS